MSWKTDRDLVIARILAVGDGESNRWLRRHTTDDELRQWFRETRGKRAQIASFALLGAHPRAETFGRGRLDRRP
jgi:hypothetical protein